MGTSRSGASLYLNPNSPCVCPWAWAPSTIQLVATRLGTIAYLCAGVSFALCTLALSFPHSSVVSFSSSKTQLLLLSTQNCPGQTGLPSLAVPTIQSYFHCKICFYRSQLPSCLYGFLRPGTVLSKFLICGSE
jgi:hypothetical protein